jgi:hypothetical protein
MQFLSQFLSQEQRVTKIVILTGMVAVKAVIVQGAIEETALLSRQIATRA